MLKKIRIGRRLFLAFSLVSGIISVAAVTALMYISTIGGRYNILAENALIQGNISKFSAGLYEEGELVRYIIDTTAQSEMTTAKEEYEISKEETQKAFELMKISAYSQQSMELLKQIESSMGQFRLLCGNALDLRQQNAADQALEIYRSQARPQLIELKETADMLMDINIETENQLSSELSAQTVLCVSSVCFILILGILAAILLAIYNTRLITRPLIELERAAASMAEGNYEAVISYESPDEIGSLADKMRTVIQNHR